MAAFVGWAGPPRRRAPGTIGGGGGGGPAPGTGGGGGGGLTDPGGGGGGGGTGAPDGSGGGGGGAGGDKLDTELDLERSDEASLSAVPSEVVISFACSIWRFISFSFSSYLVISLSCSALIRSISFLRKSTVSLLDSTVVC